MTARTDDQSVAQRVLDHIERGTTDTGDEVWREPVSNYRSEGRLAAELSVMRRLPVPFCPSAALPEKGSYVAREAAGVPLLVVRGADDKVRAFRNACRHRGAQLASGSGCAKSFVCPYHAWTYTLEGKLRHVPHEEGFPGLDKSLNGLVPVHAEERLGLVFVNQEGTHPAMDDLPVLVKPHQEIFAVSERELEVNWKVFLEGFIEGYHIRFTHPESFFPYGFDNLNLIDFYGHSSRITYPFKRITKLEKVHPKKRKVEGLLTYVYHVFPNVLITILSRHTNVVILEPLSAGRTRQITYALANDAGEEALAEARRDKDFVGNVGAVEDLAVVTSIQKSIGSGANEVFTFGKFEGCIVHFHRALGAALAGLG
jgi:phenylpropionate dioxygenase-like ring-hydroxylating dioxygenase large terminal subunit